MKARPIPTTIAPTAQAADRLGNEPSLLRIRDPVVEPMASGTMASVSRTPPIAMSGGDQVASSGRRMNGTAVATASGTASGWRPAPPGRSPSHQPAMNRIAAPRKTDGIASAHAAPAVVEDSTPGSSHCRPFPSVRSHGWIAWRLRIGAAIRATSWSPEIATSVGVGGLHTDRLGLWHLARVRVRARLDQRGSG